MDPADHARTEAEALLNHHPATGHIHTSRPIGGDVIYSFGSRGQVKGPDNDPFTHRQALLKGAAILHGYDHLTLGPLRATLDRILAVDPVASLVTLQTLTRGGGEVGRTVATASGLDEANAQAFTDHLRTALAMRESNPDPAHPQRSPLDRLIQLMGETRLETNTTHLPSGAWSFTVGDRFVEGPDTPPTHIKALYLASAVHYGYDDVPEGRVWLALNQALADAPSVLAKRYLPRTKISRVVQDLWTEGEMAGWEMELFTERFERALRENGIHPPPDGPPQPGPTPEQRPSKREAAHEAFAGALEESAAVAATQASPGALRRALDTVLDVLDL